MSANLSEILKDKLSSMSDTEINRIMDDIQKVSKDIESPSAGEYIRFLEQMKKHAETQTKSANPKRGGVGNRSRPVAR